MSEAQAKTKGILYIISCASRPAQGVQDLVTLAQAAGWNVCVIATPQATKFINTPLLEQLTGYPIRAEYKRPEEPDVLPRADAIIVFPATFNTLNKWALGISDTLAVGLLCEYTGLRMPIVAVPCVLTGSGLDTHPAFFKSMESLRAYGIHVLYEPEKYPPKNEVPWNIILEELDRLVERTKNNEILPGE
ncbi:MAG TPA: flavoprotein [Ktedonobacteraceae bacterium]|nr:flavoprotein [Ktedonobacteraceae bacterium]